MPEYNQNYSENSLPNVMLSELISSAKNRVSQLDIKSRDILNCLHLGCSNPQLEFKSLHLVHNETQTELNFSFVCI